MQIRFQFRPELAVQAAAFFLRKLGGRTDKIKLMKLMYLADRDHFLRHGHPITGDAQYALPHGPVPTCTLNLLSGLWDEPECAIDYIACESKAFVIAKDPGDSLLMPTHLAVLEEVFDTYGRKNSWKLREETHRLPEYQECEVPGSSAIIPYEVILKHHAGETGFRGGRPVVTPQIARHMECPFESPETDL